MNITWILFSLRKTTAWLYHRFESPISSQANQGLVAMDLVQFKHGFHVCMLIANFQKSETWALPIFSFPSLLPLCLPHAHTTHTAKVELQGIDRWPSSPTARKQNISKAINFLRKDGVTLHHDAVKGKTVSKLWSYPPPSPCSPPLSHCFLHYRVSGLLVLSFQVWFLDRMQFLWS